MTNDKPDKPEAKPLDELAVEIIHSIDHWLNLSEIYVNTKAFRRGVQKDIKELVQANRAALEGMRGELRCQRISPQVGAHAGSHSYIVRTLSGRHLYQTSFNDLESAKQSAVNYLEDLGLAAVFEEDDDENTST